MLITRPAARSVVFVPLFALIASSTIFVFSLAMLLQAEGGAPIPAAVVGLVVGGGSLLLGLGSCRSLRASDEELIARALRKRKTLRRAACAFGVRLQTSGRYSSFIVFVTDSKTEDDVAEFSGERGARRAIEPLEKCLLPAPARADRQLERARKQVERVEREWQGRIAPALKAVNAYYASPAWRATIFLVIGLVMLYVAGMSIYMSMSGR